MNKTAPAVDDVILDKETLAGFPQQPHGGKLVDRVARGAERERLLKAAGTLPKIMIDAEAAITLEMIATGVLSPNEGLMVEGDYLSTLETGRLRDGTVWPIPLSFAPTGQRNREVVESLTSGDDVVLIDAEHRPVAILHTEDIFAYDRDHRAQHVFGTTDRKHPGVDAIYRRMGDKSLGGKITLLNRADWGPFEPIRLEPRDTWRKFYVENSFETVAGFVTGANPMHRGHEYMHRNMLEKVDGLLVCPLVEMAKREYTRHEFRMAAYRSVLEQYYPPARTILCPLRVTYVFAGPREAVLHALILKNFGCTHKVVGRDYAGVGSYYDKYASQDIFSRFTPEEIGIDIQTFYEVFYCVRCSSAATEQTCPHDDSVRVYISGTGVRELLRHGVLPPREIVRPESAHAAIQGVQPKGRDTDGNTVMPVGKIIKSMFPFYLTHRGIGGVRRERPLNPDELTNEDLEAAIVDVRQNGDLIYRQIHEAYARNLDLNRSVQAAWIDQARATMRRHQERLIADLEQKVASAPAETSDEFMYQDRAEAERELAVARRILDELAAALDDEKTAGRVWNIAPYDNYY